jgi:cytochrome P450
MSDAATAAGVMDRLRAASPVEVAVATVLLTTLAWLFLSLRKKARYDMDKMPGPWKNGLPWLGNLFDLVTPDFHRVFLGWSDKYGGILRFSFAGNNCVLVTDPQALGTIMGRGEGALDKAAISYKPINFMCDPHGNPNLLTAWADDAWKVIRKAVAVSFSFQNIKRKFPTVLDRINVLTARLAALGPDASVDVDQAALRVTLDVIGLAGFGHDFESVNQDTPEYEHLLRVLPRCFTEVMLRVANPLRAVFPRWFKNGPKGEIAFKMFQREMAMLLNQMKERGPPDEDDHDIAAQLYRVMAEHPEVSEARVLSEIGILFVEGFETTGHTTSWTLFNIATHPEAQRRIAEELDSLGLLWKAGCPPPRELELDDLKRLPFLSACTKEAMRMLPVVSVMGRMPTKDVNIGPYRVPAYTLVVTPLFAIQNTVHNWEAPHEFRPERWEGVPVETYVYNSTDGASKTGITFMPFSEGPRNCVGQSLAKMEVLTLLAKLLATFEIELAPEMGGRDGIRKRESTHLTLQTAGTKGIRCRLRPRSPAVAMATADAPAFPLKSDKSVSPFDMTANCL